MADRSRKQPQGGAKGRGGAAQGGGANKRGPSAQGTNQRGRTPQGSGTNQRGRTPQVRGTAQRPATGRRKVSEVDPDLVQLAGDRPRDRQTAFVDVSDVDDLGSITDTDLYEGELEAGVHDDLPNEPDEQNLELLTERELRAGETANPDVAAEEGLTWVPPIDPPVVPSESSPEGAEIAAGFGVSALDEEYDEDHHSSVLPSEDEMTSRIREAIRADSATTEFADHLAIATRGGVVRVRGVVEDVDDSDNVLAVIERVDGVVEVIDELQVRVLS
jgi:hypothetical protein